MKEKSKRDKLSRPIFNRLSFFLLWIVLAPGLAAFSHTLFLRFMDLIRELRGGDVLTESFGFLVLLESLLLVSLIAPIEKILLKFGFGRWIKGWVSARLISTVISIMPIILLEAFNLQQLAMNSSQNAALILLTAAIAAVPQIWVLSHYVKKSWLYGLAAMFSSLVPVFLVSQLQGLAFGASFTIGASAAIIALMMLWFFSALPGEENFISAEAGDFERLEDQTPETEEIQEDDFEIQQQQLRFSHRS